MENELRNIIGDAQKTRLSITASRLLQLDCTEYSAKEHLEIIYWLIVCGKYAEAYASIVMLKAKHLTAEQQALSYAACLRLSLQHYDVALPVEPEPKYLPHWVKTFLHIHKEVVCPIQFKMMDIAQTPRKEPFLMVEVECVACGAPVLSSARSNLIIKGDAEITDWLCPHCLAMQRTSRRALRDVLWEKFSDFFAALPVDSSGSLEDNDVGVTLLWASVLEPYAPIRFCSFRQDRVGHLCYGGVRILEQMGGSEKLTLDFYGFETKFFTANTVLANMWKRFFNSTVAAQQLYWFAHAVDMPHLAPLVQHPTYTEPHSGRYSYPLQMNFSEMQQGMRALEAMGVPRGAKIACLFVRDGDYLSSIHPTKTDAGHEYRNADINTYQKACEKLVAHGWYVLRMGATAGKEITWTSDYIIDYAKHFRSEFMDVWLWLYSDLCLGMGSGPDILFAMRSRPWLVTNAVDLFYLAILSADSLVLPKHVVRAQTQQHVSLKEYLLYEANYKSGQKNLAEGNLQYIDNTSEEIYDTVCEQLAIIEGRQCYSQEDIAIRKQYQELGSHQYDDWGAMRANFSLVFLRAEEQG